MHLYVIGKGAEKCIRESESVTVTVRVRATLRLTVYRRSVRLGDKTLETHDQIFFQLNTCDHSSYVRSSLMRRWVCRLQLNLALASAVILRSESRGTHDHILLSQIRDFPFRRLLRLAGLRWRYSTLPPHGLQPRNISLRCICIYIVEYRSVANQCLCKQRSLLSNTRSIHGSSNRTSVSYVVRAATAAMQRRVKHASKTIVGLCFLCGLRRRKLLKTTGATVQLRF